MAELRKLFLKGTVDDNNSTNSTLPISGVFTGTATEILDCGIVYVSVFTDRQLT